MNFHTTGEVAKKLNLSVRTIRYYDQIGLFTPSEKDDYGKRLYSEEDLITLEKITILKKLNLPLADIKMVLTTITIEQLLLANQNSLHERIAELNDSLAYTNTLLNVLHLEGKINWEQLLPLIKNANEKRLIERNWDTYFEEDEKQKLKNRLPKMESNDSQIKKWINLGRRVELCLGKGETPQSEEGQLIAEDGLILSAELSSGNEELAEKFFEIRKSPEKSQEINLYPVKTEVLQFLEEAIEIHERNRLVQSNR